VSNKVIIEVISHKDVVSTYVDKRLFEWVITNLINNAIDAMKMQTNKNITINIEEGKKQVFIDVKDNGSGITKDLQKKIFREGFTTKERGWGLGLPLAERIISQYHHGRIFLLKSTLDVGTTFRIILPKK
jgi:signal transduction histidine kinase